MKTTIVVEDGGVTTLSFESSAAAPVQNDSRASESAPVDAGAAPAERGRSSRRSGVAQRRVGRRDAAVMAGRSHRPSRWDDRTHLA